jgi:hypothetical protein
VIYLKDLGADLLATAAVDAVGPVNLRGRMRHDKKQFSVIGFQFWLAEKVPKEKFR